MGKILGIDLGTTNSVMAVWDGREPRLIASEQGTRLTPSVVGFGANGDVFVGEVARRQAVANARRTISSVKRFVGQRYDSVAADRAAVPYEVVAGHDGEALIQIGDRAWAPEEISAHVLRELKRSAEAFLGEAVDGAVITVPAYFNDAQRAATKEAGRLAGLDVRRIINEPTAAALAYGLDKDREKVVAVYDFGGGTFDVSILLVGEDLVEVISTHGDTHLGGDDIDSRVVAWLVAQFHDRTGVLINGDAAAHQRLREAAEHAKIDLSSRTATEINIPFLAADSKGPLHLEVVLSRPILEGMIVDLVERTLASCVHALADANKKPTEIDEVVLVGGSSRIPVIQQRVAEYFHKEPRRTVNPDEVVALGAAVQAGVLSGEVKGIVLLDVTSLSLGVETHNGETAFIIPRNTTIPTESMRTFTTATDGQTSVEINVVQGEGERARLNDSLGRFDLDGLRAAPAGTPQIDVTFAIDLNGMVQVSARDRATGRSQTVSVSARTGVAKEPALGGSKTSALGRPPLSSVGTAAGAGHAASGTAAHAAAAPAHAGSALDAFAAAQAAAVAQQAWPSGAPGPGAGQPGGGGPDPSREASLPSPVQAVLKEAEQLLGTLGDKLGGHDRASIEKTVHQLRSIASGAAAADEVERSRSALRQLITHVKEALLTRRGR